MKKVFTFFLFLAVMGINAYAQTMVAVSSNVFTPADITIEVGETVQWDNTGGTHNVNGSTSTYPSNPESFGNGAASSMAWTYSYTFNTPGVYDYQCDPHVGLGMVGKVTVNMPAVQTNALMITGVYDAQPAGAGAKGIELYALADIADLSTFGLGSANNGGGTDGEEFTFPAVSVTAGNCLYIATDSTDFADFFGFNADFINGPAAGINGDDAIELFENGTVIDVFGDIDVDGSGTAWDYLDGWAYRNNGTGPDGSTFNIDNWTFSGVDALQDVATNADAANPFPNCSYSTSNLTNALVIAGVFDAQPSAAGTKGIELYALEDIADLSVFGLGGANNGGGSDSIEFVFPAMAMAAGSCFFVVDDSTKFADFFGFNADFVEISSGTSATGINGDDAIELFENGTVIDVFGDINVDGSGTAWEYLDGWAYRKNGTGPDGSTFNIDNWNFSGVDQLQGGATNADAPTPYTNCAYFFEPPAMLIAMDDNATTDTNTVVTIDVLANDALPNDFTSVTIDMMASNGMASTNGDGTLNYLPSTDFCGTDMFTYIVCDATSACDTATVTVNVTCPTVYLELPIGDVNNVDPVTGIADSLGQPFEITGIVYGVDLQGADDAIQFTIIDKFNADEGIGLFSGDGATFGYTVNEGDEVVVQGVISQFRGLTQITPDTLWRVSEGNALHDPTVVTVLSEDTESNLIRFENMKYVDIAEWNPGGSGFNVRITNGGTDTITMRIDNDVDLFNMTAPAFDLFNVTGIGGQFTFNPEDFDGYQFLPRYMEDIDEIVSVVDPTISQNVSIAPNPVSETLFVSMTEQMDRLAITNILGQAVRTIENPQRLEEINVSNLPSGIFVLTFVNGDKIWSTQFVKE